MRRFLAFLIKRHIVVLFLILQSLALYLSAQQNAFQKAGYISSSNYWIGTYYKFLNDAVSFVRLSTINDSLSAENARLKTLLVTSLRYDSTTKTSVIDTALQQQFTYTWAKVVNSTAHLSANYLIIDKGSNQGIKPRSGVMTSNGIAGIVHQVSPHFSSVISVLNPKFRLSCIIEPLNYTGVIFWDGSDYQTGTLNDIPRHLPVKKGMKIVTSPYSNLFPSGIPVGYISDLELPSGSNTYKITVKLNSDMRKLDYVYVVDDLLKEERNVLEKQITEDVQ